jgi:Na+/H+ antiporter NhaD/arsenite permease-like protein
LWERPWFQALVSAVCMSPVLFGLLQSGHDSAVFHAVSGYATFIVTLLALYVAAGGVYVTADFPATPRTNVLFVLLGSVLASVIGTTGASLLLLRPFLRTNSQRAHRAHLVPFFILAVANAGGLLTPVGDPPLLMGFVSGVPFFWTLQLWPIWLLYVGTFALGLYLVDRRAYARESAESLRRDDVEQAPLLVKGKFNLVALCAVIPAAFMPAGFRELALVAIAVLSFVLTPKAIHRDNDFNFGPILEVGLVFLGLFVCLIPLETTLMQRAAELPIQQAWQMFLASGVLSAVLDNAPTYAAFAALARGLGQGQPDLVAGIAPLTLAALSAGSVVMGALTYIGNGPNLMVKSLAQRSGYTMPSFGRYSALAFVAMLPANVILTLALAMFAR